MAPIFLSFLSMAVGITTHAYRPPFRSFLQSRFRDVDRARSFVSPIGTLARMPRLRLQYRHHRRVGSTHSILHVCHHPCPFTFTHMYSKTLYSSHFISMEVVFCERREIKNGFMKPARCAGGTIWGASINSAQYVGPGPSRSASAFPIFFFAQLEVRLTTFKFWSSLILFFSVPRQTRLGCPTR